MKREGIKKLPLYPEERDCTAPTAARVIEVFDKLQRHILSGEQGQRVQTFMLEISELQEKVLGLPDIPLNFSWLILIDSSGVAEWGQISSR